MASAWISALAMLLAFVNETKNAIATSLCAEIRTSSPVVTLGSELSVSCLIHGGCFLTKGETVHVEWHLNQQILASSLVADGTGGAFRVKAPCCDESDGPLANYSSSHSPPANHSSAISPPANDTIWISTITIPSFNDTRAQLTCCVGKLPCQIVGGLEIRAGFPPAVPQNLQCVTNLTRPNSMSCTWDPGKETHLPTKYTLHTTIRDRNQNKTYELQPGIYYYRIPRSDFTFYSNMEIFVKGVNALGQASSTPLVLEPLASAKLEPPNILNVQTESNKYGCLQISWSLAQLLRWVPLNLLKLEVRMKTGESNQWPEDPVPVTRKSESWVQVCHLFHGTDYHIQVRVRGQQSPWSEWSNSHSGVTLERAPSKGLDFWMKVSRVRTPKKHLSVHLFWKPSKQFHANAKNVSFTVSFQRPSGEKALVCATQERHCAFQLPIRVRKIYLRAVNAVGKSNSTDVRVFSQQGQVAVTDLTATPGAEKSLFVQWSSIPSSDVTSYVVEWAPSLNASAILFDLVDGNQTSFLIWESIEPYTPYWITVYPRFTNGLGLPQTIQAYSRQKAPSAAPELRHAKLGNSSIMLVWDEIPLSQRNGIVTSYKVFYWDKGEHVKDVLAAMLILITVGAGLFLLVIVTALTCLAKHERLKMCFWPMIPDPANSSIKRWTSDTIKDFPPDQEIQESSIVCLSHLSLWDLSKKLEKEGDDHWLHGDMEDTSDLGESICSSPISPGYTGSQSESIPYATVVFSCPYTSQPPTKACVFLRSESNQPLLENEEPPSPQSYQNMPINWKPKQQGFFTENQDVSVTLRDNSDTLWNDFPLLQALALSDTQSEL
ncbi:granulocyte colony-stimulating factor receptor [Aplochiton taeniatus]